jgi:peptidoglycan/xylan/chitin deacetylase (PgdA/CDA1 family)
VDTYTLVLTHDIDVMSLQELPWLCLTLWGFSYRCLMAAFFRGVMKLTIRQRLQAFWYGISMPLIKLGLVRDPWKSSLDLLLDMERRLGVRSTLYFLPFPNIRGTTVSGEPAPANRSIFYSVKEHREQIRALEAEGWEIGVHGIDAHWSAEAAERERHEITAVLGHDHLGIRMHWLYHKGRETFEILSKAGYVYDATPGWNDKVGFPEERFQPYAPINGDPFQVLPLNIQDCAMFEELRLSEDEAWNETTAILKKAALHHAVITVLWHNDSFALPRFWGSFYERLIKQAREDGARIVRAIDIVRTEDEKVHSDQRAAI